MSQEAQPPVSDNAPGSEDPTLADLDRKISELALLVKERLSHDAAKDKAFEFLYRQMESHESGFVASVKRPLLMAILRVYDDVSASLAQLVAEDPVAQALSSVRDDLSDLLENEDVTRIASSDLLDKSFHKVVRTTPAGSPEEDGQIERIVRHGFRFGERLLRSEEVVVRVYSDPNP